MTKYLILVKHSIPHMEEDRPAKTWKLSEEGRARAHRLAELLESYAPEVIVSSDEPKARETAEVLAKHLQLGMQTLPGLYEHDRSDVPYLSDTAFQEAVREFFQKPDEIVFGNESADQAHSRFYGVVHLVLSRYRNKTIVVVTHGTVISLFVSRLTGSSGLELWSQMGLPSFIALDLHSSALIVRNTIA